MAEENIQHFTDLGAGLGSTLIPLADRWPERQFTGVENAPLTWLTGRILSVGRPNLDWRWGSLWQTQLHDQDMVYTFLSPTPMPELWEKLRQEMKPGSLLVSNSFPVPGQNPERVIEIDCHPARTLYYYRF